MSAKGAIMPHSRVFLALAVAAAILAGGCATTELPVRQYPSGYDPQVRTIAVAEFDNQTPNARAGEYVAQRLSSVLRATRS